MSEALNSRQVTFSADRVMNAINNLHRQAFLIIGSDLVIEWASDGVMSLIAMSPAQVMGRSALDFVHPDDVGEVAAMVLPDLQPGIARRDLGHRPTMDFRLAHAEHGWVTLTVHSSHALDADDVRGLVVQLSPPDQLRDVANGVIAAANGRPLEVCLTLLIRSIGLGLPADPKAVMVDVFNNVLAATPESSSHRGAQFELETWMKEEGSLWSTPIYGPISGRRLGQLVMFSPLMRVPLFDIRAGIDVAAHSGVLIEGDRDRRALERAATTDPLTGLHNKAALLDQMSVSQTQPSSRYVIFIDLDGFKSINDQYGHGVGDDLLIEVGRILRSAVRGDDLVARIGGDEFAVVVTSSATADQILDRLKEAFNGATMVSGTYRIPVRASIGIAVFGDDAHAALDAADKAMYKDKSARMAIGSIEQQSLRFER